MHTVILSVPIFCEEEDITANTAREVFTPGSSIASYPWTDGLFDSGKWLTLDH